MGDENLLLYLNLSGELFYIVAHRMKSQEIPTDLQQKVFNDLSIAICTPDTINELLCGKLRIVRMSFSEVRARMSTIVHSTIMKINDYSMERLFELTLIATKYQFVVCQHPTDILLIVLNHLDAIRATISDSLALEQMAFLHDILVETYGKKQNHVMAEYRGEVLNYVQDVRLKMTNLINLGLQTPSGEFVMETDGMVHSDCVSKPVRLECYEYNRKGERTGENVLLLDDTHSRPRQKSSLEQYGDRVITLGQSIYDYDRPEGTPHVPASKRTSASQNQARVNTTASTTSILENVAINDRKAGTRDVSDAEPIADPERIDALSAVQGLDLCSTLLGCETVQHVGRIGTSREPSNTSGCEESSGYPKARLDDLSVNTVRIDARCDRRESNASLANILRHLEMPDCDSTATRTRTNVSELMENMIESEDSN